MEPERWKEVEKLYNAAMEHKPDQRAAFLAQACAGNEWLRAKVESLLAHGERAGSFMEASAMEMVARELAADSVQSEGEQPVHDPPPLAGRKPRKRAPWWMFVLAAIFLICAAVRYYGYYEAPVFPPGFAIQPFRDKNGLVIGAVFRFVAPNSAAESAGVKRGDTLLFSDSDGLLPSSDVFSQSDRSYRFLGYWQSGHTYRIKIQRKGEIKVLFLTLRRNPLSNWLRYPGIINRFSVLLRVALYLILAAIIAFARPYDTAARWGALFLAIFAINSVYFIALGDVGWFSTVLGFPRVIGWLTALLPSLCAAFWLSSGMMFFASFPRKFFQRPWPWVLLWLPAMILTPLLIFSDHAPIYSFPRLWPGWYENLDRILLTFGFCAVVAITILNYRRLLDLNERRRFRILVAGLTVTLIGTLPNAASGLLRQWDTVIRMLSRIPYNIWLVFACFNWAFPISMAYAILRHRVFDIRVMIRMGLRYAATRGALISLVPIVGVVLASDLMFHGNQPLMQILGQRGLFYALLAGGGFLLHIRRHIWLDALDRRFFRERYDAQRVLRSVVDEIREAPSFEKVAPHVVLQIEAALHPEFAALLVRRPGEAKYRALAAQEKVPPPIPVDGKFMGLVRLLGKPVEISQSQTGWLRSQLPQQESEFLRQACLEWLFPICLAEGRTEALLAMGPKRSEEPYSREDQDLLQGITSSLALLLEQSPSSAPMREGFEECPSCGACYDSDSGHCAKEGAKLTPQPFPRLLDHRYRFDQKLGEGGMGTVYRAFDTELERQVAVKLIRSDMTVSAEATARFKQEAKAAASFTHANVVTVYDFGAAEKQRAYLVMELLRGLTLRQELSKSGRLLPPRALKVLRGVCTAVDAAHRGRLLHRDLKPENIFLSNAESDETVKILDFGVVKPIAPVDTTWSIGQTGPGMLVGTLKYMSPEQLRGEKPAEKWDLWALAVVAYEMLTGIHPFGGSTVVDVHNAILAGRVIPVRTHLPDAPQSWQHFFDQALSTRVELRPNSALQLFADFSHSIQ